MPRNHNNFTVSGLIGNVKLITTKSGTELLNFSIANVENIKVGDVWENKTHWINCTLWKPSESEKRNIEKGLKVFVSGVFTPTEKDGKTYWNLRVLTIDYEYKKNYAEPNQLTDTEENYEGGDDVPF